MKYKVSNVCQLCDKSKYSSSQTNYGITTTNNGDGTFTLNGTCTNTGSINIIQYMNMIIGHVYYLTFDYTGSWRALMPTINNFVAVTKKEGVIMAAETNIGTNMYCYCVINTVLNNVTIRPQLFDLTEMYGAGNEPTTVEEFRKDFPDEYYEYSPKCFETIHKLHYVNEAGKYLTMNRGKFVNNYCNIDLSKLNWAIYGNINSNYLFYATVPHGLKNVGINNEIKFKFTSKYETSNIAINGSAALAKDSPFACWDAYNSQILIKDTTYKSVDSFINNLIGVQLIYPALGKGYFNFN